jgi:hypothetical protein
MRRVWLGSEGITFLQKSDNLGLDDGLASLDKNPFRIVSVRTLPFYEPTSESSLLGSTS